MGNFPLTTPPQWLQLTQGTDEWKAVRKEHLTSTDIAALLGTAKYQPKNKAEVWAFKKTAARPYVNWQMAKGTEMEEGETRYLEDYLGTSLQPGCVRREIDGVPYMSSLDGVDMDRTKYGEIKTCGETSDTWKWVKEKMTCPPWYYPQVQQGMLVSDIHECHMLFRNRDSDERLVIQVQPDQVLWAAIVDAGSAFWPAMQLAENPFVEAGRVDVAWAEAAGELRAASLLFDVVEARVKAAKKALEELSGKNPAQGMGVRVRWQERAGAVDYGRIESLKGVDLEQYRKKPTRYAVVEVVDD